MSIENEEAIVEKEAGKTNREVVYDDLLSSVGELGRYQWLLFFSTCPFFAFGVCVYYSQMFMTEVSPNHWCWIPELANMTGIQRRELGIPKDANTRLGYIQCEMYSVNWTDVLTANQKPNHSWTSIPCKYGWEFNKTEIPYATIGSDFEWVCKKNNYQATAQAMFFVGSILGGLIFGWVSDRFGRIPAIMCSCFIGSVGGFASTFVRNFIEFTAARFVMGMSYDTCMILAYLLILEYIGPRYRTLLANMSFAIFYSLFVTALPWIALLCDHWKIISLVTSLPLTLGVLAKFFLPESPLWLLSKGRVDEAIEQVQVIGRINRREVDPDLIINFKKSVKDVQLEEYQSLLEIFRRPTLRRVFILSCLENMCCTLVFDGLIRSIEQLDFDFFISFSVISFTEFPSVLIVGFIMDYMGRRWLCTVFNAISCLFCILIIFVSGGLTVIFAIIARFAVNMSYSATLQWGPELLPTSVRGSGVATIHICGFIVSFLSPYIVYLKMYCYWLPLTVIGTIAGIGMAIALVLPETAMSVMPETFEDVEEMIKKQNLWTLPFIESRKEKK